MVSNPTLEAHPTTLRLLLHPSPPAPSLCPLSSILVRFLLLCCRSQEKSRQDFCYPYSRLTSEAWQAQNHQAWVRGQGWGPRPPSPQEPHKTNIRSTGSVEAVMLYGSWGCYILLECLWLTFRGS